MSERENAEEVELQDPENVPEELKPLWRQFPREQAREAVRKSRAEGVEYGFMWCSWDGGHTGNLYRGDESRVVYTLQVCGHIKGVFHTHPSGSLSMSQQDKRFFDVDKTHRIMAVCNPETGEARFYENEDGDSFGVTIKA